MLGDYANVTPSTIHIEEFDPDTNPTFGLFNLAGNEVKGPSYKRISIKDAEKVADETYILKFQPTEPGELWSFMCLVMYDDDETDDVSAVLVLPFVLVLYGSIQGSYSFKVKPAENGA